MWFDVARLLTFSDKTLIKENISSIWPKILSDCHFLYNSTLYWTSECQTSIYGSSFCSKHILYWFFAIFLLALVQNKCSPLSLGKSKLARFEEKSRERGVNTSDLVILLNDFTSIKGVKTLWRFQMFRGKIINTPILSKLSGIRHIHQGSEIIMF